MSSVHDRTPSHPSVVVIGEALVDVVSSAGVTVEHPGGSPANVAYGLGRLGVNTALLTSIGDDDRAEVIEKHLLSVNVSLLPGSRVPGRTATATAVLAADGSARYEFDVDWNLPPVAPLVLPRVLHAGSIATFLAPGATAVRNLLEQSHERCVVTYDPNIRPALLGSHSEARAIFEDLVPLTDVVKLSDEDAGWLYPRLSPDQAARHILELGSTLVAVTQGAEGSLLATSDTLITVPAVTSTVADTIGAGDSYMAALIYGILGRGTEGFAPPVLESLGCLAATAAAITVRRPGANPPTSQELHAELPEHVTVPG
ncbi:fructokinase [Arthrobacter sp. yr096]|uniref:carbohydrate kinase family protein n=1 Tax=Arthrobacter sp. yr096 TaxID=1761750 RepID=UPI0008B652DF|nr:carbohydrate kinase [Arthrobacter sp. yr096]SEI85372.1 fructokinase [Arthrobacter sp. yr096]